MTKSTLASWHCKCISDHFYVMKELWWVKWDWSIRNHADAIEAISILGTKTFTLIEILPKNRRVSSYSFFSLKVFLHLTRHTSSSLLTGASSFGLSFVLEGSRVISCREQVSLERRISFWDDHREWGVAVVVFVVVHRRHRPRRRSDEFASTTSFASLRWSSSAGFLWREIYAADGAVVLRCPARNASTRISSVWFCQWWNSAPWWWMNVNSTDDRSHRWYRWLVFLVRGTVARAYKSLSNSDAERRSSQWIENDCSKEGEYWSKHYLDHKRWMKSNPAPVEKEWEWYDVEYAHWFLNCRRWTVDRTPPSLNRAIDWPEGVEGMIQLHRDSRSMTLLDELHRRESLSCQDQFQSLTQMRRWLNKNTFLCDTRNHIRTE